MAEEAKQNNSTRRGHKKQGDKHATAKQLQMILQVEGTQAMYRQIHHAEGKQRMKGVTMVLEQNNQTG